MSLENAKANLEEFAKELKLELKFDENHTCVLGIDNVFSLHLTHEPNSDRLYLYSPVLDGLPTDDKLKLELYQALLEGSMLGVQMAGGGVGVAVKEGLILMHSSLDMGLGSDASALRRFAPIFVEAVEKWRERADSIKSGKGDLPVEQRGPTGAPGGGNPMTQNVKKGPGAGPGGEQFIKI